MVKSISRKSFLALFSALGLFLTACGSEGGSGSGGVTPPPPPPPPPPPAAFTLKVTPAALELEPGESATAKVEVARTGSFAGVVDLSANEVEGLTISFDPAAVAAGATESTIKVAVSEDAKDGSYPVTITGKSGDKQATATLGVAVTAPAEPELPPGEGYQIKQVIYSGTEEISAFYAVDGNKARTEVNFPYPVATILDGEAKVTYTLFPEEKTYLEDKWGFFGAPTIPTFPALPALPVLPEFTELPYVILQYAPVCEELEEAEVADRPAIKLSCSVTIPGLIPFLGGKTYEYTAWQDEESGLEVRRAFPTEEDLLFDTTELDYQVDLPDTLFTVPADYTPVTANPYD